MEWFQRNTVGKEISQTVAHVACVIILDLSGEARFFEIDALRKAVDVFRKTLAEDTAVCDRIALSLVEAADAEARVLGGFTLPRVPFDIAPRAGGLYAFDQGVELSLSGCDQLKQYWRMNGFVVRRPFFIVVSSSLSTEEMMDAVYAKQNEAKLSDSFDGVRLITMSALEALGERAYAEDGLRIVLDENYTCAMFSHAASVVAMSVQSRTDKVDYRFSETVTMPYRGMSFFGLAYEPDE